ncbi:MAG: hypothetical protein ACJ790_16280 [Myxococcaceae bacterium]
MPVLLGISLLLSGVAVFFGNYDFPPDEDGIASVPMVRKPEFEITAAGPVPMVPIRLREVTFRITLRWLDDAPSHDARTQAVKELAASLLPDYTCQPRPFAGKALRLHRVPLVAMPGFEFVNITHPLSPDLSRYEQATSDTLATASGQRHRNIPVEQLQLLSREATMIDFHLKGEDAAGQLARIDAFITALAKKTRAIVRADEMYRMLDPDTFFQTRAGRTVNGIPFAPAYMALAQARTGGLRRLGTEGAEVVGLPELWLDVPDGLGTDAQRHLLLAATVQRLLENPMPDGEGRLEISARELKHPDLRGWATTMLPEHATGKISLSVREVSVENGRLLMMEIEGDPLTSYCAFAGCDVAASISAQRPGAEGRR